MGRRLVPEQVVETTETLHRRVAERFPEANLTGFCADLVEVARKAEVRTRWIRRPLLSLRVGVAALILALVATAIGGLVAAGPVASADGATLGDFLQSTEAVLSSMVILGAAAFFLVTLELRIKRVRALNAIHELRELAHIVDMYQLTKDPTPPPDEREDTRSSPDRSMTPYELSRYLDYCSEMLALISKIGALYGADLRDPVVLAGIDGLQGLIDGLTQKIWHKMRLIE